MQSQLFLRLLPQKWVMWYQFINFPLHLRLFFPFVLKDGVIFSPDHIQLLHGLHHEAMVSDWVTYEAKDEYQNRGDTSNVP